MLSFGLIRNSFFALERPGGDGLSFNLALWGPLRGGLGGEFEADSVSFVRLDLSTDR